MTRSCRSISTGGATPSPKAAAEEALAREFSAPRAAGLDADEAFLVALTCVSAGHPATREFARSYADSLLTAPRTTEAAAGRERGATREFWVMLACAAGAALAIKVPALFGYRFSGDDEAFCVLNLSFFVLPFLVAYFAWRRPVPRRYLLLIAGAFAAAAVFANAYPYASEGSTLVLELEFQLQAAERIAALPGFLAYCKGYRPHGGLDGDTPLGRLRATTS